MLPLLVAVAIACILLGASEARRRLVERRSVLTPCLGSLSHPRLSFAPDGYPRLSGEIDGFRCRLAIVPDSLALRRLPQLWLVVAMAPSGVLPRLAITARPRGDDFVSNAFEYAHQLDAPSWLPRDVMVRGGDDTSGATLERLRAPLAALFGDPLTKEVSLGPSGLRLVYRLAEGERASHLLLRQCRFSAQVDPALFDHLRLQLVALDAAATRNALATAA